MNKWTKRGAWALAAVAIYGAAPSPDNPGHRAMYEQKTEQQSEQVRRDQRKDEADADQEALRKDKENLAEHRPPPPRDVARKIVRRP